MAGYKVFFRKSVHKDLSAIPKKDLKKILYRIQSLIDYLYSSKSEAEKKYVRFARDKADFGAQSSSRYHWPGSWIAVQNTPHISSRSLQKWA